MTRTRRWTTSTVRCGTCPTCSSSAPVISRRTAATTRRAQPVRWRSGQPRHSSRSTCRAGACWPDVRRMTHSLVDAARARNDSLYGVHECAWSLRDDGLQVEMRVPGNTPATLVVPVGVADGVELDGK